MHDMISNYRARAYDWYGKNVGSPTVGAGALPWVQLPCCGLWVPFPSMLARRHHPKSKEYPRSVASSSHLSMSRSVTVA